MGRLRRSGRASGDFLGKLEQVEFLPGWYQQSLDQLQEISVACAFWDVDLQASFRACMVG